MLNLLEGKKTVIAAVSLILFGVAGILLGKLDPAKAMELILEGLGFLGLRLAKK